MLEQDKICLHYICNGGRYQIMTLHRYSINDVISPILHHKENIVSWIPKWKLSVKFWCQFFTTRYELLFSLTYSHITRKATFYGKGHEICFALCALTINTREYSVHAFLIIVYKLVLGILLFIRCVCIDKTNYKP